MSALVPLGRAVLEPATAGRVAFDRAALTPEQAFAYIVLPAAFSLLPPKPHPIEAAALLVAIARQESGFKHRRQIARFDAGIPVYGPARSWLQFEQIGVQGVLEHPKTKAEALAVLQALGYGIASYAEVHRAIEHNDILAAAFGRLALVPDRRALPGPDQSTDGWLYYQAMWRPGKPHPQTWRAHFDAAWAHYQAPASRT